MEETTTRHGSSLEKTYGFRFVYLQTNSLRAGTNKLPRVHQNRLKTLAGAMLGQSTSKERGNEE